MGEQRSAEYHQQTAQGEARDPQKADTRSAEQEDTAHDPGQRLHVMNS